MGISSHDFFNLIFTRTMCIKLAAAVNGPHCIFFVITLNIPSPSNYIYV